MPIRPENRQRYPADWPAISRRIREDRAGWRCECDGRCGSRHCPASDAWAERWKWPEPVTRCTARDGFAHPSTGSRVVLTVAHLDHTPEHCDDNNLLALCQACHLSYDTAHHAQSRAADRERALAEQGQLTLGNGDTAGAGAIAGLLAAAAAARAKGSRRR